MPEDRESVFYLNIKAIPGRASDAKNNLLIAVKSTLKLFYRPSFLTDDKVEKAWEQLKITQSNGELIVSNHSPCFITFYSLSADGTPVVVKDHEMIPPFGQQHYSVSARSIHKVSWQVIGDQAQISQMYTGTVP